MKSLLLLLIGGLSLPASILTVRWLDARRLARTVFTYRLRFPRQLRPSDVEHFLRGITGVAAGPRDFLGQPHVVFELTATSAGITHHLIAAERLVAAVAVQLRAQMGDVRLERDRAHQPLDPQAVVELRTAGAAGQLRTQEPAATSAAVLAALQPLRDDEELRLQWVLRPSFAEDRLGEINDGRRASAPPARVFLAAVRIGVRAASPQRRQHLIRRTTSVFRAVGNAGRRTTVRPAIGPLAARRFRQRALPIVEWPLHLTVEELTGLLGFPLGGPVLAGLQLGGTRQLAPPAEVASTGRVLAQASYPGASRPIALGVDDALHHVHLLGPTGSGKSHTLANLALQDIAAGHGVIVLDPKADLVDTLLDRLPSDRVRQVVVLDPSDEDRPVGLRLLPEPGDYAELGVEHIVGIFRELFADFWGPRTDDILRAALLTLTTEPDLTLCEVPLLLTDETFRRRLVARLDDPVALGPFWSTFESWSTAERLAAIGPVMNKLRAVLMRRRVRNIVGQSEPALDFNDVLAERKVVLVSLAKGLLGDDASRLLGSLVVARIWQATLARAALPASARPPVFLYIDEVQDYLRLGDSVGDLLAQARGLGLGLVAAHQHLAQLPSSLRTAVLSNARTKVVWQPSADDARQMAREFQPHLTAEDLRGLDRYEVALRVCVAGRVSDPTIGRTLPLPEPTQRAKSARAWSRQHFGRDRAEVEAAIRQRGQFTPPPGSIGRRRRAS